MADKPDRDSQTEEATDKKIRDAIERGNVPVSREVSIFAFVAGLLVVMAFFLKSGSASLVLMLQQLLDNADGWHFSTGYDAIALCGLIAQQAGGLLVPAFIVFFVAGLAASFSQRSAAYCVRAYQAGSFAAFAGRWLAPYVQHPGRDRISQEPGEIHRDRHHRHVDAASRQAAICQCAVC